jgi:hypothetical protein
VRVESSIEILNVSDEVRRANPLADLPHEKARQLADLDVFQTQLASRVTSGDLRALDRGDEGRLFRVRPADKMILEVGERYGEGRPILVAQRTLKIFEPAAQGALGCEERVEPVGQIPASPGSIRV